jgi:hypothetical protein
VFTQDADSEDDFGIGMSADEQRRNVIAFHLLCRQGKAGEARQILNRFDNCQELEELINSRSLRVSNWSIPR